MLDHQTRPAGPSCPVPSFRRTGSGGDSEEGALEGAPGGPATAAPEVSSALGMHPVLCQEALLGRAGSPAHVSPGTQGSLLHLLRGPRWLGSLEGRT